MTYLHLPSGAARTQAGQDRYDVKPAELPSSTHYLMIIRPRFVYIIACSFAQGTELYQEALAYRATWAEAGKRHVRIRLREGRPLFSPRKRYCLTSADSYFHHWRSRR